MTQTQDTTNTTQYKPSLEVSIPIRDSLGNPTGSFKTLSTDNPAELAEFYEVNAYKSSKKNHEGSKDSNGNFRKKKPKTRKTTIKQLDEAEGGLEKIVRNKKLRDEVIRQNRDVADLV
jgi:hypothetical protein